MRMDSAIFPVSYLMLGLLSYSLFSVSSAQAFNATGIEEFMIHTAVSEHEYTASSAYDGKNFLVTWASALFNGPSGIRAQVVSPSGELIGNEIRTGVRGSSPVLVEYDGSNFLMTWVEELSALYGQFVTSEGTTLGPQFQLLDTGASHVSGMAVGNSASLVVIDDGYTVRGALVSKSSKGTAGSLQERAFMISDGEYRSRKFSSAAFDGKNFLVAWVDGRNGLPEKEIYGQFVSETGSLVGGDFVITKNNYDSGSFPAGIVFDGNDYLVTWGEKVSAGHWTIFGRFISPDGNSAGEKIAIANSSNTQYPGVMMWVAYDGKDYAIEWLESVGTPETRIMARFMTRSGELKDAFTLLDKNQNGIPAYASNIHLAGDTYFMSATRCQSFLSNPGNNPPTPVGGRIYGETFSVMKTKPTPVSVTIQSPAAGSRLDNRTVSILLTVSGDSVNRTEISVWRNGTLVNSTTLTGNGTLSTTLGVPSGGTYDVLATAHGNALDSSAAEAANISVASGAPQQACKNTGERCSKGGDCCNGNCTNSTCMAATQPTQPAKDDGMMIYAAIAAILLLVAGAALWLGGNPPRTQQTPPESPSA